MREVTRTWRDLFLGFRIALDLRKMFLGFLVLLTTALVGGLVLLVLMWARTDEQNGLADLAEQTRADELQRLTTRIQAVESTPVDQRTAEQEAEWALLDNRRRLLAQGSSLRDEIYRLEMQIRAAGNDGNVDLDEMREILAGKRVELAVLLGINDIRSAIRDLEAIPARERTPQMEVQLRERRLEAERLLAHPERHVAESDASLWVNTGDKGFPDILLGAIGGDRADVERFAGLARLALADYGLWHATHPLTGEPRRLADPPLLEVALILLAGLVWWWFASRQLGAMARIAAVEISRDVRIEVGKANDFARQKRRSLFVAPVLIDALFLVLFVGVFLWGWLGGLIPWVGPVVALVTSPLVIFAGFLMALLLIGGTFGFPLLVPAIAVEGTDSFDALSRSFSYVFSRPWHYLWYWLVGTVYGAISIAFVLGFTGLMLGLAALPARMAWGTGFSDVIAFVIPSDTIYTWITWDAARPFVTLGSIAQDHGPVMVGFALATLVLMIVLVGMAVSYAVSYLTTMYTLTYFLLRARVDGTDISEIFYDEDDDLWMAPAPEAAQALAETAAATTGTTGSDVASDEASPGDDDASGKDDGGKGDPA